MTTALIITAWVLSMATLMRTKNRKPRILVAGLGNLLLKDDGVGVHAVRVLQQDPPAGALVVEIGTAVLTALDLLEWADKILAIDAMQAFGSPGTVYAFGADDVEQPEARTSLHELSLLNGLRMINRKTPPEIAILGVEPEAINYGLELSPAVLSALPKLMAATRAMVDHWRR